MILTEMPCVLSSGKIVQSFTTKWDVGCRFSVHTYQQVEAVPLPLFQFAESSSFLLRVFPVFKWKIYLINFTWYNTSNGKHSTRKYLNQSLTVSYKQHDRTPKVLVLHLELVPGLKKKKKLNLHLHALQDIKANSQNEQHAECFPSESQTQLLHLSFTEKRISQHVSKASRVLCCESNVSRKCSCLNLHTRAAEALAYGTPDEENQKSFYQ